MVVAEPPAPGSDGMDRRAPGWSGVVLFGASALLVKAGTISWDARLFRILNQVPPTVASVLTPLSHLFLPTGIIAVVVLTVVYAVAETEVSCQ